MKTVWVIKQIDAEPWEDLWDDVHSIYKDKEKAFEYYLNNDGVLDEDEDGYGGYMLMEPFEVELADGEE